MARVFLSYASSDRHAAEPVALTLANAGHQVFYDHASLHEAADFDGEIRRAIDACDLFVFLLSPESVQPSRYTLTELKFARQRWPGPQGRVLTVLLRPTPLEDTPHYLRSVQMLRIEGNLAAEVRAAVDHLAQALNDSAATRRRARHARLWPLLAVPALALAAWPLLSQPECRDPSHGLERAGREDIVERWSDPMPVDALPAQWCEQVATELRQAQPQHQVSVRLAERAQDPACRDALLPCSLARTHCRLAVRSPDLFALRASAACRR